MKEVVALINQKRRSSKGYNNTCYREVLKKTDIMRGDKSKTKKLDLLCKAISSSRERPKQNLLHGILTVNVSVILKICSYCLYK
jgi:hypothetical protein